ncbi:molybdate ABC transporter substrate-binding protein [Rothia kristinae]|uniref:molybdate ABC transporter substrate-binding protein n=1 Tax=Rothia kristinae TaxID=37923 RepID=UPI0022E46D40|nr:molybdate ABC transporter substrate-binding protein [Rothia kristinae]
MNQTMRRLSLPAVGVCALLLLPACGSGADSAADSSASSSAAADQEGDQRVTVFAAASLTKAGDELAAKYRESHPDAQIQFNYAGSSKLVQQIDQGADPDLFISADRKNMDKARQLSAFSDADDPTVIATNTLQLVTAADNPAGIGSIQDISDDRIAVCAPEVPCGTLAQEALDAAGVSLEKPSEEANVSAVSTKISQGSVDAGFVYSTDAQALNADGQRYTAIDLQGIQENEYPMSLTHTGQSKETARQFAQWLSTDEARQILAKYGFGAPQQ